MAETVEDAGFRPNRSVVVAVRQSRLVIEIGREISEKVKDGPLKNGMHYSIFRSALLSKDSDFLKLL